MARASTFAVLAGALLVAAVPLAGCGGGSSNHGDDDDGSGTPDANPLAGVTAVPLTSNGAFFYTAPVTIGTQTFALDIDTGSTTLGVAGDQCSSCGVSPTYTTAHGVDTGKHVSATYLDGTGWSGEVYGDDVSIGSAHTENIKFVAISDQSGFFRGQGGDQGIVGLAGPSSLIHNTSSYLESATARGDFKAAFGVELCKEFGTLWFGGIDPSASTTPLVTTPMLDAPATASFWTVQETAVSLGGTVVNGASFGNIVLDTGSTLSTVPSAFMDELLSAINSDPGYASAFPGQSLTANSCVSTSMSASQIDAALPRLGITFTGAAEVTFPATRSYLFNERTGVWCFAFENGDGAVDGSIFGDSLLNGMLVAFDLAGSGDVRIGESDCPSTDVVVGPAPILTAGDHPWYLDVPGIHRPHIDPITHQLTHTVVR